MGILAGDGVRRGDFVTYPGKGKHVVLIAGDEEDRLPMPGKILSRHHGFKCAVWFSVSPEGVIDHNSGTRLTNYEPLMYGFGTFHKDVKPSARNP